MYTAVPYRYILERRRGDDWVEIGQYACEAYAEEAMSEREVSDRARVATLEARLGARWGDEFFRLSPSLCGSRYRVRPLVAVVRSGAPCVEPDTELLDDYECDRAPLWFDVVRLLFRLFGVRL